MGKPLEAQRGDNKSQFKMSQHLEGGKTGRSAHLRRVAGKVYEGARRPDKKE